MVSPDLWRFGETDAFGARRPPAEGQADARRPRHRGSPDRLRGQLALVQGGAGRRRRGRGELHLAATRLGRRRAAPALARRGWRARRKLALGGGPVRVRGGILLRLLL